MRVLAAVFALTAIAMLVVGLVGSITGRPGARTGGILRLLALLSFIVAVILNTAAH